MPMFRQIGVIVLLLLLLAFAPAIACAYQYAHLTPAEQACCEAMHFQCDQMAMPMSHGCCQKAPSSVQDTALVAKAVEIHPALAAVVWLAASDVLDPDAVFAGLVERPEYSPPKPSPSTISILRI